MVVFQRCPTVHGPQESAAKSRSAAPADKPPRLLPQLPSTATIPISTLNFQELPDHYGGGRDLTPPLAGTRAAVRQPQTSWSSVGAPPQSAGRLHL